MKALYFNRQAEVCKGDVCIRANGKNADLIAGAGFFLLLCFGIAAIVKAAR